MNKKKSSTEEKAITFNPPVIKSFFAAIPKEHNFIDMQILILGQKRKQAINFCERWNEENWNELKQDWRIIKVEAKTVL